MLQKDERWEKAEQNILRKHFQYFYIYRDNFRMIFYQSFRVYYITQKLSELKLIQISDQIFEDLLIFQYFVKTLKSKSHKIFNENEKKVLQK